MSDKPLDDVVSSDGPTDTAGGLTGVTGDLTGNNILSDQIII